MILFLWDIQYLQWIDMLKRYLLDLALNYGSRLKCPFSCTSASPPKHPNAESLAAAIPTGPTEEPLQQLWPLARAYLGTCGAGNVTLLLLLAPWRWFFYHGRCGSHCGLKRDSNRQFWTIFCRGLTSRNGSLTGKHWDSTCKVWMCPANIWVWQSQRWF